MYCDVGIVCNKLYIPKTIENAITINGLLSGHIEKNFYGDGKPVPIRLGPARLGGGNNLWILSFHSDEPYQYKDITGDTINIVDRRTELPSEKDTPLREFKLSKFLNLAATMTNQTMVEKFKIQSAVTAALTEKTKPLYNPENLMG